MKFSLSWVQAEWTLRSSRLKIERAKKHLLEFEAEKDFFLSTKPYGVAARFKPEQKLTEYVVGTVPEIPDSLSVIVGDVVHNLRSSLDHLASELVRDAGGSDAGIYYPICENFQRYQSESPGKTRGMRPEAKEAIDSTKPYGGGNEALWGLHQLSITDKHKLLVPVAHRVGTFSVNLTSEYRNYFMAFPAPFEEGAVIGAIEGEREESDMQFAFDLVFGYPEVFTQLPVVETLSGLALWADAIVAHFDADSEAC
jgi:hypothetical protein